MSADMILILPPSRRAHPASDFVGGTLFGFLAVFTFVVVAPALLGWHTLSVMSGSMSPAIDTGDAVLTRPARPASLRGGDVVTFRDPEGSGRLITHRVRWVRTLGNSVEVTTKGDANTNTERWQLPANGRVGRVVLRLPYAGFVLAPSASPIGRMMLVALPTFLLGAISLAAIWRKRPGDEAMPAPTGAGRVAGISEWHAHAPR